MKPHIKKHSAGYWICYVPPEDFSLYLRIGYGSSPHQAFLAWLYR